MNNQSLQKIVFCLSFFLGCDTAFALPKVFSEGVVGQISQATVGSGASASAGSPPSGSAIKIESSKGEISLKADNSFLTDVLQQVANQTSIQFDIGSLLTGHKMTVDIQGPDWNSVMESLLRDFSRVTIWNQDSGSIKEVHLLGINNGEPRQNFASASFDNTAKSQENLNPGLSVAQLKRLVRVPLGNSLPSNLFAEQEIRHFLELKGIHSPEEWQQPKKARTALHMAKKELTRLLYEKQKQAGAN